MKILLVYILLQRYFKFAINKKKDNFICHFGQKYLCGGKAAAVRRLGIKNKWIYFVLLLLNRIFTPRNL